MEALRASVKSGDVQKDRVIQLRKGFSRGDEAYRKKYVRGLEFIRPLKAAFIDRFAPVYDALTSKAPRYAIEKAIYSGSQREGYIRDMFRMVQKPLEKAGLSSQDMDEFLFHRRVVEERNKMANPQAAWRTLPALHRQE